MFNRHSSITFNKYTIPCLRDKDSARLQIINYFEYFILLNRLSWFFFCRMILNINESTTFFRCISSYKETNVNVYIQKDTRSPINLYT